MKGLRGQDGLDDALELGKEEGAETLGRAGLNQSMPALYNRAGAGKAKKGKARRPQSSDIRDGSEHGSSRLRDGHKVSRR